MPIGMSKQAWFNTITEPIVKDGLIFRVDAGNTNSYPGSGTTWFDLSPNANNGTLTNGPTFNSDNKGSIVFDGSNDYVDFGNSSTLNVGNSLSVCTWFYVGSTGSYQTMVSKVGTTAGVSTGWEFANSSGNIRITIRGTTNIDRQAAGLAVGNWYMGTFTYTTTPTTKVYINEQEKISWSSGNATHNTSYILRVGGRHLSTGYYNGRISQTLIYNKVLSLDEISQNFNALRYRYGI